MTRKDYVLIARAIRQARNEYDDIPIGISCVTLHLANALERDNPRFDRDRFISAATGDI